jgi:replicative DNA helicase
MYGVAGLAEIVAEADELVRGGRPFSPAPFATGFDPLDSHLAGGVRPGELVLIGGPQGLGKTTLALQMARNIASAGGVALYLCYEHDARVLLHRLLALEIGLVAGYGDAPTLQEITAALEVTTPDSDGVSGRLRSIPLAAEALRRLTAYGDRLRLVKASGRSTGLDDIRALAAEASGVGVLFVDYLQKVSAVGCERDNEDERVTVIVEGLKDAAMEFGVPVVALAAADKSGLGEGRTRLRDLRGSTALAYECDIALMLNDKWHVVARHHLMFDSVNASRYRDWVVLTIDKNRAGKAEVDLEFRKCFAQARFDVEGRVVREELIDDRVFRD